VQGINYKEKKRTLKILILCVCLKRENAFIVSKLMTMGLSNYWLLKPKEDPVVRNCRTGPQQRCSIGCKTSASVAKLDEVASYLSKVGIIF
jgi:hypothetical protein